MRTAAILIALLILSGAARASSFPSPDDVRRQIHLRGGPATVDDLDEHGRFDAILDRIERGDRRWIALAPLLATGTDGADGEGLSVVLARGLLVAPDAVLGILVVGDGTRDVDVARVCDIPFIEPPPGYDARYLRRAIRALRRVRTPKLQDMKARCLAELQS